MTVASIAQIPRGGGPAQTSTDASGTFTFNDPRPNLVIVGAEAGIFIKRYFSDNTADTDSFWVSPPWTIGAVNIDSIQFFGNTGVAVCEEVRF